MGETKTKKRVLKWWIKERRNPQLGTYYVAMGQMSEAKAKKSLRPLYGHNVMHWFDSEEKYKARLNELLNSGEAIQ